MSLLPASLIASLDNIKGFDKNAFEEVHAQGNAVTSVRVNTFKSKIENLSLDIQDKIDWCESGYYLKERPSFTLDPSFHAGAYYVQEASSMFLWQILQQSVENVTGIKVLDLCAAPGGKSTLLASYFTKGFIVSNEVIRARANILSENIAKWGCDNVVVTSSDPKDIGTLKNYFNVIVVDAPCSGSGLFRKDKDAIDEWSEDNVKLCSQRQQRILHDVLPSLKENGVLIYSTCSFSKQEDEDICDELMKEHSFESIQLQLKDEWNIVETESDAHKAFGYRFYPYKIKGEGFFIAAFKKKNGEDDIRIKPQVLTTVSKEEMNVVQSFLPLNDEFSLFKQGETIRAIKKEWLNEVAFLASQLYIKKAGIALGAVKGKDFIPEHELALSLLDLSSLASFEMDKDAALQFLRRKDLSCVLPKGWQLLRYNRLPLGWVKALPNRINNYYPKEWRILKDG